MIHRSHAEVDVCHIALRTTVKADLCQETTDRCIQGFVRMSAVRGMTSIILPSILLLNVLMAAAYNGILVTHGCFLYSHTDMRQLLCVAEISKIFSLSEFYLNWSTSIPSKCETTKPPEERSIEARISWQVTHVTRILRCPLGTSNFLDKAELCWMSAGYWKCLETTVSMPLSQVNTSVCGYMLESPRRALPYFIEHHLQAGFDRIQIYVNHTLLQDGTIRSSNYNQRVRFVPWTNYLSRSGIFYGGQTAAIYHCQLSHFKQAGVLCILDVDDFLTFPNRTEYNLQSLQEEMQGGDHPQVLFKWKVRYPECQPAGGCSNFDIKACFPCLRATPHRHPKHCSIQSRIDWEGIHRSWHSLQMKELVATTEKALVEHIRRGRVRRGHCCNGTEFRSILF